MEKVFRSCFDQSVVIPLSESMLMLGKIYYFSFNKKSTKSFINLQEFNQQNINPLDKITDSRFDYITLSEENVFHDVLRIF